MFLNYVLASHILTSSLNHLTNIYTNFDRCLNWWQGKGVLGCLDTGFHHGGRTGSVHFFHKVILQKWFTLFNFTIVELSWRGTGVRRRNCKIWMDHYISAIVVFHPELAKLCRPHMFLCRMDLSILSRLADSVLQLSPVTSSVWRWITTLQVFLLLGNDTLTFLL